MPAAPPPLTQKLFNEAHFRLVSVHVASTERGQFGHRTRLLSWPVHAPSSGRRLIKSQSFWSVSCRVSGCNHSEIGNGPRPISFRHTHNSHRTKTHRNWGRSKSSSRANLIIKVPVGEVVADVDEAQRKRDRESSIRTQCNQYC